MVPPSGLCASPAELSSADSSVILLLAAVVCDDSAAALVGPAGSMSGAGDCGTVLGVSGTLLWATRSRIFSATTACQVNRGAGVPAAPRGALPSSTPASLRMLKDGVSSLSTCSAADAAAQVAQEDSLTEGGDSGLLGQLLDTLTSEMSALSASC